MPLKLEIELIPSSAWCSNVRTQVKKSEWDILRRKCYQKAGHKCEICGGKGEQHPVECHEIWEWRQGGVSQNHQILTGLIALCPTCHRVKHIGRVQAVEPHLFNMVMNHFAQVNGLTSDQAMHALAEAYELWRVRSEKTWQLDISFIQRYLTDDPATVPRRQS